MVSMLFDEEDDSDDVVCVCSGDVVACTWAVLGILAGAENCRGATGAGDV
jgi:hypothetical protein